MTVQELIDLAKAVELQGLAVRDENASIVGFINLGLIEIYKRFPLEMNEHLVALQPNIELYTMPNDFMYLVAAYGEVDPNSAEEVNVLKVNTEDDPMSINTVSWNKVQIPTTVEGENISLIYVASPTAVSVDSLGDTVPIPPQMVEALLHYIGYRGHTAVNGELQAENSAHYARFEASIAKVTALGLFNQDDVDTGDRINTRGFV